MKGSVFAAAWVKPSPADQATRDALVRDAVAAGGWIRWPTSLVEIQHKGRTIGLTVAIDYFAIGEEDDYVRVPVGAPLAQALADGIGFQIPTAKMTDLIWLAATWQVEPITAAAIGVAIGAEQESGAACVKHSRAVDAALPSVNLPGLRAGLKKDIVISNRLTLPPEPRPPPALTSFNRDGVFIYGWHRKQPAPDCSKLPATPGLCPIQGLSSVHERTYADYSHGLRMVGKTALLDGKAVPLADLLMDQTIGWALSHEGPMKVTRYGGPLPTVPSGQGWCQGFAEGCGVGDAGSKSGAAFAALGTVAFAGLAGAAAYLERRYL